MIFAEWKFEVVIGNGNFVLRVNLRRKHLHGMTSSSNIKAVNIVTEA